MADTSQEVLEGIRAHLEGRGLDGSKVQFDAHLGDDLDLDSLDTVEMTLGLEKRFGIEIPDEDLADVETIRQVVDLIVQKQTQVTT
ncbi:MAG: phosphopantetheine-binding protein [Actinomycetota bacterium]